MKIDARKLPKLRALFALRRMSPEMQSDVLSDSAISEKAEIKLSKTIHLSENRSVDRTILFEAIRCAAEGRPVIPLVDSEKKALDAQIEVRDDAALITYEDKRLRFGEAALLVSSKEQRRGIMDRALSRHTLAREARNQLEALTQKNSFTDDDFFSATALFSSSPESFEERLRQQAETKTFARNDFLPLEPQYWDNLVGTPVTSSTLADYIANELIVEYAERRARDPLNTLIVGSIWFLAPAVVSRVFDKSIASDLTFEAIGRIARMTDPFALTGAFNVCAERVPMDKRFEEAGASILAKLVGDEKQLLAQLSTFATAFIFSTAYLAEHETLRRKPVFWRRLAATAHASLVTRILGGTSNDESSLLTWAMRLSGKTFYLSVLNEARAQPRWRPDWIEPTFLAADIYGRIRSSVARMPSDQIPDTWRDMLVRLEELIEQKSLTIATYYPAILEGDRRDPTQELPTNPMIEAVYTDVLSDPTPEKFLRLTNLVYMLGLNPIAHDAALAAVSLVRAETTPTDTLSVLGLASYAAAQSFDVVLADAAAQACIERAHIATDGDRILHSLIILLECAAAHKDEDEATAVLAQRLESLAFIAPREWLPELVDLLHTLQNLNGKLAVLLGRAIATARLGRPR
jgi:hypothetical protein